MITCTAWVKRGAAKETPDKISLSKDEIEEIIQDARNKLRIKEEEEGESRTQQVSEKVENKYTEKKKKKKKGNKEDDDEDLEEILREYNLYEEDEEEGVVMEGAGMAGLTYYASNKEDPYILIKDDPDEDEKQDWEIKSTDGLIITGHVEDEFCNLEIFVWNEEEDNYYVHHDILMESFPLVVEWLDYDTSGEQNHGNFVAVGTMEPHIDIWDLDVIDTMEPVVTLGRRRKKIKKKSKNTSSSAGHSDAVLDLSWNHNIRNVLASGSADHSVILWDMAQAQAAHVLNHHKDKVQSLEFHPYEPQTLLTGSFDKKAKVVDCRSPESNVKTWKFNGEVERVIWNHFQPFNFLTSTDNGFVYSCDVRTGSPVFTLNAHDSAIGGLSLSSQVPDCLLTASADGTVKVWDLKDNKPSFIMSRDMQMGHILSASCCPDSAYVFAIAGEKQGLKIFDLMKSAPVRRHFEGRERLARVSGASGESSLAKEEKTTDQDETRDVEPMDEESAASAMADLKLNASTGAKKKKKKKKGK